MNKSIEYLDKQWSLRDLCVEFNKSEDWVTKRVRGSVFDPNIPKGKLILHKEEYLSVDEVMDIYNKSRKWVTNRVFDGIFNKTKFETRNKISYEGKLYSVSDLTKKLGRPHAWVVKRTQKGVFNPDTKFKSTAKASLEYKGELYSKRQLGKMFGKSTHWVDNRTRNGKFDENLVKASNLEYKGNFYKCTQLASIFGKSLDWVNNRTKDNKFDHGNFKPRDRTMPKSQFFYKGELITTYELMEKLGVTYSYVYRRVKDGYFHPRPQNKKFESFRYDKSTFSYVVHYEDEDYNVIDLTKKLGISIEELASRSVEGVYRKMRANAKPKDKVVKKDPEKDLWQWNDTQKIRDKGEISEETIGTSIKGKELVQRPMTPYERKLYGLD